MLERVAPGIAEAIRADAIAKTPHGLLSRGVAGVRGTRARRQPPRLDRAAAATGTRCSVPRSITPCGCWPMRRQSTRRRDAAVHRRGRALRHRVHVGPRATRSRRLLERFGPSCMTVLEPGSGTGRMLEALALRGLAPCGIDSSPAMVAFSRARLADAGVHAGVMLADMTNFELDRALRRSGLPDQHALASHRGRARVAPRADGGPRRARERDYLVQVGVFDNDDRPPAERVGGGARRNRRSLRVGFDSNRDLGATSRAAPSRAQVLAGPRKGEAVRRGARDDRVDARLAWRAAIAASPFAQVALATTAAIGAARTVEL